MLRVILIVLLLCPVQFAAAKINPDPEAAITLNKWREINKVICGKLRVTEFLWQNYTRKRLLLVEYEGRLIIRALLTVSYVPLKVYVLDKGLMVPYPHMDNVQTAYELQEYILVAATLYANHRDEQLVICG